MEFIKKSIAGLACLGMLAPQVSLQAQPVESQIAQKIQVADFSITNGVLVGHVVSPQGQTLSGATVKVSRDGVFVSETVTNAEGQFQLTGLSTGNYQVSAGEGVATVRVWDAQIAPPAAKSQMLLVNGTGERGQILRSMPQIGVNGLVVGGIVVGVVTAVVVASQDDDPVSP